MNNSPDSSLSDISWTFLQSDQSAEALESIEIKFFSDDERGISSRFSSLRRKGEWLMGRLAAKALIQYHLRLKVSLNQIQINTQPSGAPLPQVDGTILPGVLSISHMDKWACAAYSQNLHFGVDIEALTFPHPHVISDYLSGAENSQIALQPEETQNSWRVLTWSLKEAFVKALRLGFLLDPLSIHVTFPQQGKLLSAGGWQTATIATKYDAARGFWRLCNEAVVSFAILDAQLASESIRLNFLAVDEALLI